MALPTNVETAIRKFFIPKLVDNIFSYTYLLERLWDRHTVQTGGDGFEQPLAYGKNENVGTYVKYGTFRRTPGEVITKSVVSWADYYVTIPFSEKELRDNQGRQGQEKLLDLAATYVEIGEKSLKERLAHDIYGTGAAYEWPAGSGDVINPLTGLRSIVAVDRTYGAIDSTTYTWWDGTVLACSGTPTWANLQDSSNADYLPARMRELIHLCNDGSDEVTVIVCPKIIFQALAGIADTRERFEKARVGRGKAKGDGKGWMGFTALMFDDVPVIPDSYCPAGYLFALNEDHLYMRTQAGADMSPQPMEHIPGTDASLKTILLSTNINCSNCSRQGVLTGLPTSK